MGNETASSIYHKLKAMQVNEIIEIHVGLKGRIHVFAKKLGIKIKYRKSEKYMVGTIKRIS